MTVKGLFLEIRTSRKIEKVSERALRSGRLEVFEQQLHAGDAVVLVDVETISGADAPRRALGEVELDGLEAGAVFHQRQLEVLVLEDALPLHGEFVGEHRHRKTLSPDLRLEHSR